MSYLEEYTNDNFSGFEGEEVSAYTGANDDFLDFSGTCNSFANETDSGRTFNVVIVNGTSAVKKIVLFNGYRKTVLMDEILANDGTLISPVTKEPISASVSAQPSSLTDLTEFLKINPANLAGIRVSSTSPQQMEQNLTIEEISPFKSLGSREFFLSRYISENTFRDNMATVPTPGVVIGAETKVAMNILPNSTVTITLFFGGILSNSVALKNKYKKAVSSISAIGVNNVLRAQAVKRGLPQ